MRNHFIHAEATYSTIEKQVPAPYFRRIFRVEDEVKEAKIQICGLGFYELHVNGFNITKGHLAPYRSNHDDYLYYDEYDITQYIIEGQNVIAVLLGNGMQNAWGGRVWDFDKASWRSAPLVSFAVQLESKTGEKTIFYSDEQTRTSPSPIIFDDLHWGEGYDARQEIIGWNTVEYDDKHWSTAKKTEAPKGKLRLANVEPIKVQRLIEPVSWFECEQIGGYIYDFGVNTSGICRLTIEGSKRGQEIKLLHFETKVDEKPFLDGIGFKFLHIDDPFQQDVYICKGEAQETYVPHFTFHGFRYVYVTGITPEQATESLLTYMEMSSNLEAAGTFSCSDKMANQIQEATVRSDISNFYYFPMDCPQREKNGWTADAALSAEQMLLNLHAEKSLREWMMNVYKAIDEEGRLPGIIPTTGWGYTWGNGPAWDNVLVYIPYYVYKYTGEKGILEECAEPLMKYLTYLSTTGEENLWPVARHPFMQVHVVSDVAWSICNYYNCSGDDEFMVQYGMEMLYEICRYWLSRVEKDERGYVINQVTGTDEHHPYVDNNAYTNYVVHYIANRTLELTEKYGKKLENVQKRANVSQEMLENIKDLVGHIYLPFDKVSGMIPQFDGYFDLSRGLEVVGGNQAKAFQMKASGLYHKSQVIKQPDVLVLFAYQNMQFPALSYKRNWDYYRARCEASSSLSYCVHSICASDMDEPESAYTYFMETAMMDLNDEHHCAFQGIHSACAAGAWMAIVRGVGGTVLREDKVEINPHMIPWWKSVKYSFTWHGQRVYVTLSNEEVCIYGEETNSESVPVVVSGKPYDVKPGAKIVCEQNIF